MAERPNGDTGGAPASAGGGGWFQRGRGVLRDRGIATKAAISIVALAGVATSATLVYVGQQDQIEQATEAPRNAEELLSRIDETLGRDGDVLHLTFETQGSSDGVDYDLAVEAWFDFQEGEALIAYERDWANLDEPERWKELLDGRDVYVFPGETPATSTRTTIDETRPTCIPSPSYLAGILACGVLPGSEDIEPGSLSLVTGDTVGLAYEETHAVPTRPDGFAPPTPTPSAGTPTAVPSATATATVTTRYVFVVEGATMLPVRLDAVGTHSEDGELGRYVLNFESELLDRGEVDFTLFDARAQGYRTPDEIQIAMLDDAVPGGQVYWLGRSFDPGNGLPPLELARVEQRMHPQRPELIAIDYDTEAGDRVTVAVWEAEGWAAFMAMLEAARQDSGGNFVFAGDCLETEETTVNGWRVRILAGRNVQPDFGGQATATPTRGVGEGCAPRDTYMAEVYVEDGYVVTINAPIALWGPGDAYERFASPEALSAVASGLRPREQGE